MPEGLRDGIKIMIGDGQIDDGGSIADASSGLDDVKPENVRAMFEYTREYGVYC